MSDLIPIKLIKQTGLNPRGRFTDTTMLQESIRAIGLQDPLTVFCKEGNYYLIDGHRRLSAVKALGWKEIACEVKDEPENARLLMLASNNRENFSPLQLAKAFEIEQRENLTSKEQLARIGGFTIADVELYFSLLTVDPALAKRFDKGEISASALRTLLNKPKKVQKAVAESVQEGKQITKKQAQTIVAQEMQSPTFTATNTPSIIVQVGKFCADVQTQFAMLEDHEQQTMLFRLEQLIDSLKGQCHAIHS